MENVVNSEYFKLAVVLKSVLGITHHEMKDIRENISKYKKRKEIVLMMMKSLCFYLIIINSRRRD